mgnify:CR=1 FL=1
MCGIVGVVSNAPVNQLIYDALLLLQHRGQDAAGIATQLGHKFFMHKAKGMVRDVFRTRNMRALPGNNGLGQVRYPTAGNAFSEEEAQPFYVNAPFGLVLVHNGNLTNAQELRTQLFTVDHRHINTDSDSEVLLNVLAHELEKTTRGLPLKPADVFAAVRGVNKRIKGSYAVIALIAGHGLLALSAEDRRLRFGMWTNDDTIRRYVEKIDFVSDRVFGIFGLDLRLIGAAHLALNHQNRFAEIGVSVNAGERRHGYGLALLQRAKLHAVNLGFRTYFMCCLSENRTMVHLALVAGLKVAVEQGEVDAHLRLEAPNLGGVALEAVEDQMALIDLFWKQQLQWFPASVRAA